ncbi:MAG: S-layer homology domain-containing protein [Actinomycetota bacterium]
MRRLAAAALVALLIGPVMPVGADEPDEVVAFCDVPAGSWYETPVAWAKASGITTGVSATEFAPTASTTRGQIITMLFRYLTWRDGSAPVVGGHTFVDVDDGAFYADAVGWAAAADVTVGVGNDRFGPDLPTTRAQLAALLHRLDDRGPVSSGGFDDVPDGSWFDEPVHWMWDEGITTGTSHRRFSPTAVSTRAELVTFLWRLSGQPEPGEVEPAPCPRRFTVIGDSVVWGTRKGDILTGDTFDGWVGTIDARGCRQPVISAQTDICGPDAIPSTLDVVNRTAADGSIGDVVVIHAGTNGTLDDAALDLILEAVPVDTTVWLMTIRTPFGNMFVENENIREAIVRWGSRRDVRLLDWNALNDAVPGLLDRDGVHLSVAGRLAMRDLIGSALDAS